MATGPVTGQRDNKTVEESPLLEQHQRLLDASAINPGIARRRGYFSVANAGALRGLGFSRTQERTPTLLIPLWNVHGLVVCHQARPDYPRERDGKPVKYETPNGVRMLLDVHPVAQPHLSDPARPLIVTEGVRKADSAISQGIDASALLGVWNWRGSNPADGRTALADWELVALEGRPVYLAFDSDATAKPQVRAALQRLGRFLESRGAHVHIARLQPARDGGKQGLDDYLAAGGSLDELLATSATLSEQTSDLLGFQRTDLGNAHRFVAMHAGRFIYTREERRWLEWVDGRWRRDVTGSAERAAVETVESLWAQVMQLPTDERKDAALWAARSQSSAAIQAMLRLASIDDAIAVQLDQLDSDPYLLSCGNGTLDLHTGELREPDPDDLITLGTDVDYQPAALRPRWDQFTCEVFDKDAELTGFVKRAYGSALTGDTRDRAMLIEYGSRFNGKTTLNNAIRDVLGDLAHTAPIRVVMRGRQSEIPNEIAALARKRLVLVAETADGHRLDEDRVKLLTGRDRVSARFLHQEWFSFLPEYKLVLFTNFKPRVDGSDGAVWDRIRLIPFTVSFDGSRDDPQLGEKLAREREGILSWLVEGCLEWQEDGLGTCDAVEKATANYRTESDVIGRFVDDCCTIGDDKTVTRKALRGALMRYCEEGGDDEPPATTLGRWLSDRGVRATKSGSTRSYRGIGLNKGSSE
jgi:P4 family phage/plasmid primase-like protien